KVSIVPLTIFGVEDRVFLAEHHDELLKLKRPRTWTDATGKFSVTGEFAGLEDDKLTIRKTDGSKITIATTILSDKDREHAATVVFKSRLAHSLLWQVEEMENTATVQREQAARDKKAEMIAAVAGISRFSSSGGDVIQMASRF